MKETFNTIRREMSFIGLIFVATLVIFKIAFYKENFIVSLRIILSIFWLFVLPGYFIMFFWHGKLEFVERLLIGIAVAAGIVGIASYYFGLFGLNIKYHTLLLPILLILSGVMINWKQLVFSH